MNKILHYDIAEKLGEGPNGPAWLAIDSGFQRAVVIKNLERDFVTHETWRTAFLEQMQKLNRIEDLRLAHFYSLENADQKNFVVREYVDGKTVAATVKDHPIEYHRWVELALELAAIVKVIHDSGALHGNLTGSNVLLDARERVRLLDAGLALPSSDPNATSILPYTAPELRTGGAITVETDLYAVGAVLYQMITGEAPRSSVTGPALFEHYSEKQVPGIARLVIERLMAGNPTERFGSADELIVTLQTMLSLGTESGVEFVPKRRRFTSRQYMAIAVLVLLLVILWLVITTNPR